MHVLLLFTCYAGTEPGVPYNVTVRAVTAVGKGEPVSIVVFAVQQGNIEQTAEGCGQRALLCSFKEYYIICIQCHYIPHEHLSVPSLSSLHCLLFTLVACFSSVPPAPTAQVSNVKVEWMNNNRAALVSWTPLTLHQARGFPVYFVMYQPSSQVGRVVCAVSTVHTTSSSVVIGDLDPATEYTFSVDVATAGGEERGTLGPGQCMQLLECKNYV